MNAIVVALSLILAFMLLTTDLLLLLYYCIATIVATILVFLLKRRLYSRLVIGERPERAPENEKQGAFWKTLLLTFLMMLLLLGFPLLLAGFISGTAWFIVVIGFTTGAGLSEIIVYMQGKKQ